MADIALVAAKIGAVFPLQARIRAKIAAEAITKGQAVYELTTGTVGVADATTNDAKANFLGIALNAAAAGGVVDVLEEGELDGMTVAAVNCGTVLHLSETAGALADAAPAGTGTAVHCGIVTALSDADKKRVVYIHGPAML